MNMIFLLGIVIGVIIGVSFSREIIEFLTDTKIQDLYKEENE